jgi:PBSX family phage terminase large subunit
MMLTFKKTPKQEEAIAMLSSDYKYNMLYGGSRSGKTFILLYSIIIRACKEKSRHVVFRSRFNHVKTSIFLDTFPKVMHLCFPNLPYKPSKSDYYLTLPNGSEIWFAGLDSQERVEKILGHEFSTIYFNESSQINYPEVSMALTRLAEKNNLKKRAYFDENPPSKSHWSYWLFQKKINPANNSPLNNPELYSSILMNPEDNLDNIDKDYLDMLDELPDKDRDRFKKGLFGDDSDGTAYYSFKRDIHVVDDLKRIPGTLFIGMDFNVHPMTAVICQVIDDILCVLDEVYLENSDTFKMCNHLVLKNYQGNVIPDSTGANRKTSGKTDHQILRESNFIVEPTRNPYVNDRVNNLNRLLYNNKIKIHKRCGKLINDLEKVVWKDGDLYEGKDKMLGHISDALGYAAYKLFPMEKRIAARVSHYI